MNKNIYDKYFKGINELTIKNGKAYFDNNAINNIKIDNKGPIQSISISVNGYNSTVEFTKDKIFSMNCQCIIGKSGVCCKHIAAAIFSYIDKISMDDDQEIYNIFNKYTNDNNIKKSFIELYKMNQVFILKIKTFNIDIECIDIDSVKNVLNNYLSMNKILENMIIDGKQDSNKLQNKLYSKLDVLKMLYDLSKEKDKNIISKIDLRVLLEKISNLALFNINDTNYDYELIYHESKEINVQVAKTSLGYIINSDVIDGTYITINDNNFFFIIKNDKKILWFYSQWNEKDNPNLIFKLNLRTKIEKNFNDKIEEITNSSYFKANIIGQSIIQKNKPKIEFSFDFNKKVCILELFFSKQYIKKYFSKYSNEFIYKNDDYIYFETNSILVINDIFKKIKEIKKNENIHIKIDQSLIKTKKRKINYGFTKINNAIKLNIFNNDVTNESLRKIFHAYNSGKKYVLIDNILYNTEDFDFDSLKLNLENLGLNEKKYEDLSYEIDEREVFYINSKFLDNDLSNIIKKFNDEISSFKYVNKEKAPQLKDYQIYGVNWLISILSISNGCILGDEMGLGKTIQTIHMLKYFYINNNKPTLIIVPLTLISNWENEFNKFFPEKKLIKLIGTKAERISTIGNISDNNIYITTYSLIRNDINYLIKKEFLNVILDEGQYIKNNSTIWTKEIKKIKTKNRVILSGTPIENNLLELWSIFDFILPGYLPYLKKFKTEYATQDVTENKLYELSLKIKPFILQRTKQEFLDLPDKQFHNIYVTMTDNEKLLYKDLLNNLKQEIVFSVDEKNNIIKNKIEILALITKLRQFCCSAKLLGYENQNESKLKECISLIEKILRNDPKSKIVIFSNFKSMLEILDQELKKRHHFTLLMTGDNKRNERDKIIEDFKNNLKNNILLVSLKVGGVGLNLTFANNVIIYNPWWNDSAESQATDRLHRIGQLNEVNVYRLIYKNSIESNIEVLKKNKIDIINKTFNQLNYDDLIKILGEYNEK